MKNILTDCWSRTHLGHIELQVAFLDISQHYGENNLAVLVIEKVGIVVECILTIIVHRLKFPIF